MKNRSNDRSILGALRRLRVSATLAAVIYLVLGLFLILDPNASMSLLGTLIAVGVTLYGALNIITFALNREDSVYAVELVLGVCAAAFGVFMLLNPTFLINFLFVVLGLAGVVGSIGGIKRALSLRKFGYPRWAVPLVPSIVTLLVALSVVFLPDVYGGIMMAVIGVMLVVEAVSDLFSIYNLSKLTREL